MSETRFHSNSVKVIDSNGRHDIGETNECQTDSVFSDLMLFPRLMVRLVSRETIGSFEELAHQD